MRFVVVASIVGIAATASATTYPVGATRTYHSPCLLVAAVTLQPGDIVEVDQGTYTDACQLTASGTEQAPIIMRGVAGARPVFDATGIDLSGSGQVPRAIFQWTNASYWQVSHLELTKAANASNNGSGFRLTAGAHDVTFTDMSIHDNQDGAQSDGPSVITIQNSDIYANGANDGQSHNLYLQGDVVRLIGNHIHDSHGGQNIKLRTRYIEIIGNYVENAGNYEVDLIQSANTAMPNANAVLIGNVFVRATSADNNSQTILFGTDNPTDANGSRNGALYAIDNTFVLRNASNQLFHVLTTTPAPAATHVYLYNNLVYATVAGTHLTSDATTSGYITGSNNFIADGIAGVPAALTATVGGTNPGFAGSDDYHLAAGSPAIDVGLAQPKYADGSGTMQNGAPMIEPTPPIGSEPRYVVGAAIDVGAFEFGNMPTAGDDAHGFDDDAGTSSGGGKSGGCCEVDGGSAPSSWFLIAIVAASLARRRRSP
jgi:MYXO-CTERM domain-containing protein